MSTLADPINYARAQTLTDSNGLTDALGVIYANEALLDFRRRLVAGGVDAGQIQEFSQNGTANVGVYAYPTNPSMLWLKTMNLNYTSTAGQDFKVATQLDVSNIPGNKSVGWVRANTNVQDPYFDDRGDVYEIFPTPTVSHSLTSIVSGFYYKKPADFVATTDVLVYPESIDYRILGWRIAANYLYATGAMTGGGRSLSLTGDSFNARYEERVRQLIATLARGSQQPVQATILQIDGWEF